MKTLKKRYNCVVGFSGHTIGIMAAIAAVALGASIIEKHITLGRANKGTDHAASLEPEALGRYVRNIRAIEAAMARDTTPVLPDQQTDARLDLAEEAAVQRDVVIEKNVRPVVPDLRPEDIIHARVLSRYPQPREHVPLQP